MFTVFAVCGGTKVIAKVPKKKKKKKLAYKKNWDSKEKLKRYPLPNVQNETQYLPVCDHLWPTLLELIHQAECSLLLSRKRDQPTG